MDALVTAGGVPKPEEPLYQYTRGQSKALVDVAGKPMIQWVLDALGGSAKIDRVVVVGVDESSGITCSKPLALLPNSGSMISNIKEGTKKIEELNPNSKYVLVASSDIPAITPEMVDWTIDTALQTQDDLYYNVVTRPVMEARFPGSNRTYTKLRGMELAGGDMNVVANWTVTANEKLWERIEDARKSPLKQAALIGFDTLFLVLFRLVDLEAAAKQVSRRLGVKGRGLLCPYAEVAMDVDKPHQLEILRADLEKRVRH